MAIRYTSYTETYEPVHTYTFITVPCLVCSKPGSITVPASGLHEYNKGALIQDAFPSLCDGEREQLTTGLHSSCFDSINWGEEE